MDGIDEPIDSRSTDRTLGSRDPKGSRFGMMTMPLWWKEEGSQCLNSSSAVPSLPSFARTVDS
jgi:hypothetical protein